MSVKTEDFVGDSMRIGPFDIAILIGELPDPGEAGVERRYCTTGGMRMYLPDEFADIRSLVQAVAHGAAHFGDTIYCYEAKMTENDIERIANTFSDLLFFFLEGIE